MAKTYYHIPPEGGWEAQSYYVVGVSGHKGNPIFKAILYTGFLETGTDYPLGYSGVFNPTMDPEFISVKEFEFIKAIRKIDMSIPNGGKDITKLNGFEMKIHERIVK